MTAKFIVIEGIDGAGTTTQSELLKNALQNKGFSVTTTCEPSNGVIGRFLREVLAGEATPLSNEELALLFTADRMEHIRAVIQPALEECQYLICDRYYHSTLAYQLKTAGKNMEWLIEINRLAMKPVATFFLDVEVGTALARMEHSNRKKELFETEKQLKRIYHNYQLVIDRLQQQGEVIFVLDGEAAPETILEVELKILAGI